MAYDVALADRIRNAIGRRKGISEKKMFGGLGILLNGNMLVGVWKNSLVARVDPHQYDDALLEQHVGEFDITGKAMKGWVLVRPNGVASDEQVSDWVQRSIKFVGQLPKK